MWNSVIELPNGGKKDDSCYTILLSQKKQKEKIWWWPFHGKPKPKEAGGLKFGNLGLMFFFFVINFSSYPILLYVLWPIPAKNGSTSRILSPKT